MCLHSTAQHDICHKAQYDMAWDHTVGHINRAGELKSSHGFADVLQDLFQYLSTARKLLQGSHQVLVHMQG